MSAPAVLLVDGPEAVREPLRRALTNQGMLDADELHVAPQVVLVWLDPHAAQAAARVSELRDRHRRSSPAIVGVSAPVDAPALMRAAEIGLDDLLPDAAEPAQIAARAWLICESRTRFAQASPLTGLPGAGALEREISHRLPQRGQMALLAFDVDSFKSYNDRYGYRRGDDLLRYTWCVIEQALQAADGAFLAHLGGDDFFALVRPAEAEAVAQRAVELFAAGRAEYYDAADLARGAVCVRTRTGELRQVPLVTLTVASVTNEPEDLQHSGQLAAVLAELKAYGKRLGGGRVVADRRRVHDGEAAWALRQQQGRGTER